MERELIKIYLFIFLGLTPFISRAATEYGGTLASDEEFYKNVDSYYDYKTDYARFPGRVTDRDASGNIIKIMSENRNVKFFRAGDMLEFNVPSLKEARKPCIGYIRDVEKNYFVISVRDTYPCWGREDYFRRGTQLSFYSPVLSGRVKDASVYRVLLLKRKRDFLRQANDINHFLWSYDQKRVQVTAEFDQQIAELEKRKQKAMENLATKKKEGIILQKEMSKRLDELDRDIEFYRIERHELLTDRWDMDHDLGLPVDKRPQAMKPE